MDYIQLLAIDKSELNLANVEPFTMEMMDPTPVADKFMRYSPKLRAHIDKEVASLLDKGLVYPTNSPYASKVILAPKGNSWRMCIDYRKVN